MEYFKLANGALMPAIGFGTVNVAREGGRLENPLTDDFSAITTALQAGYRLFDSPLNFTKARGIKIVDPTYMQKLTLLGQRHKKSWSQILLRYNYQNGLVSIPGSSKPEHQTANLDIFDFELSELEMEEIAFKD